MKQSSAQLILKKGREKSVRNRHPWLFSGAIARVEGKPEPGEVVTLRDVDGSFLATATFHPHSQIRARILNWREEETIDRAFWSNKIKRAIQARELLGLSTDSDAYRLIYAESDGLPGLIVDKYGDYLVLQALTAGIERHKTEIVEILVEFCRPLGIVERSDADVRRKEGLPPITTIIWGAAPPETVVITEHGLKFGVNLISGHKTGFYLDQRQNRQLVGARRWVEGKTVLNLFSYSGGFGIIAAANGARRVIHVDSSIPFLEQAEVNVALNGWERPLDEYIAADVFELLRFYRDGGDRFDLIILDPPKFAHSQKDIKRAARGYKDLNWLAMRLLQPGGLLATFSCSGLISADLFQKILFGAAIDAERDVQIIKQLSQSADHPVLLTFPEGQYLDGFFCRVW